MKYDVKNFMWQNIIKSIKSQMFSMLYILEEITLYHPKLYLMLHFGP